MANTNIDYFSIISQVHSIPFGLDIIFRLLAAGLVGIVVGYERKRRLKEAGIRTHFMVAVGSALFAIVSKYGFFDVIVFDSVNIDASRVAANIVTGVCFLGAGMIFVKNKSISGLTTAAGIWAVSAIGLAFGSGMYSTATFTTLLIILIQYVFHKPLVKLEGTSVREITVVLDSVDRLDEFAEVVKSYDATARYTCIDKSHEHSVMVKFGVRIEHGDIFEDIAGFIKKYPYIKSISH